MAFNNLSDLLLLSASLSMVGFIGSILYFYISRIINSASMENDAKKELLENSLNVAAIFLLIPLFPIYDAISVNVSQQIVVNTFPNLQVPSTSQTPPSPSSFAAFFASQVLSCMRTFMYPASFLHGTFVMVRSMKNVLPNFSIGIGTDLELFGSVFDNLVNSLVYFFITYNLWVKILAFGAAFGPLFVAIGFPLRAFPPLRGAGGYLIAFGISFYFVLPLTYTYLFSAYWEDPVCDISEINPTQYLYTNPQQDPSSLLAALKLIISSFGSISEGINNFLASVFMGLCILPIAALGIALTTTSIGSSLLGARLSEIGRGLIKLI